MNKQIIGNEMLICQLLSLLPMDAFENKLLDYGYDKLSTKSLLKIFVAAQLDQWSSYSNFEVKLKAYPKLRKELGITSISGSQLSRRINDLPNELSQLLFTHIIQEINKLTYGDCGITPRIGPLKVVDSTQIKLFANLCGWANISKGVSAVKMHTRLVVISKGTAYPDKILPSTGNVSDFESSDYLIEASDATYVMDRGYGSIKNIMDWLERNISFVVRVKKCLRIYFEEDFKPSHPSVLRDAKVTFGTSNEPVRYIEFKDDHGTIYRLITTRWDLTDQEILEIYKNRWMIELFFKWVKQHLRLTKIWSTNPQGIWNQMFLALIAYGLLQLFKLKTGSKKTLWKFFELVKTYIYKSTKEFMKELNAKKTKTSRGRQKVPISKKAKPVFGNVAVCKQKKAKK